MEEKRNIRRLALTLLSEYEDMGKYVNLSLASHKADGLCREERALLTSLLYTAVEHKLTYDYYIAALAGRSLDKIDPTTKNILRLGLCQLLDMKGIPSHAAVNETVKLCRNKGERGFVNGILRAADRGRSSLPLPDRKKNNLRYLSVYYSFPLWIVKRFAGLYGEEGCEALLKRLSEISPTDLTLNTEKISREEYISRLSELGIKAEPSPYSDSSLRITGSVSPTSLPLFEEGGFFVQDAACSAAVSALSPERNNRVIDVCACPGGKTFAAALLMKNKGEVYSFDIHESKLSLIEDGAARLGLDIIKVGERDAREPDTALLGTADRVICDVPCSGLGVLAKKPDLRYKSEDGIDELPALQYEILSASAKYLKVGGRLMYSTCTLLREENEEVFDRFVRENGDYVPVDFCIGGERSDGGCFTFKPHIHNTDGFFVGILERIK